MRFSAPFLAWFLLLVAAGAGQLCRGQPLPGDVHGRRRTLQQVVTTQNVSLIAAGWWVTCGIDTNYDAYCWGRGDLLGNGVYGMSGTGGYLYTDVQTKVDFGSQKWLEISAGDSLVAGIASDYSLWIWRDSNKPLFYGGAGEWAHVAAGAHHVCAIAMNQSAFCVGEGNNGQLGDMAGTDSSTLVPVTGGYQWKQLSAGRDTTCGVMNTGSAACWGAVSSYNYYFDDIFYGSSNRYFPKLITYGPRQLYKYVSVGDDYACAIDYNDDLYCWGGRRYGKLDGAETGSNPVVVTPGIKYAHVSTCYSSTSAITVDGQWWVWGVLNANFNVEGIRSPKNIGGECPNCHRNLLYSLHWLVSVTHLASPSSPLSLVQRAMISSKQAAKVRTFVL